MLTAVERKSRRANGQCRGRDASVILLGNVEGALMGSCGLNVENWDDGAGP
jgi:hypothetical protein